MPISERIREARRNKGMTQQELADLIGVAKSTVTGYEKGNREPDALKIHAIAKALGVTGDYLLATEHVEREVFSREALNVARQYDKLNRDSQEFILTVINHEIQLTQRLQAPPAAAPAIDVTPEELADNADQHHRNVDQGTR